jgi:hypothetical protein
MAQMRPKPRSIRAQTAPIRTRSAPNRPPSPPARPANPAANFNSLTTLRITPMDRLRCSHTPSVTDPSIQLMPKVPPRVGGGGIHSPMDMIMGVSRLQVRLNENARDPVGSLAFHHEELAVLIGCCAFRLPLGQPATRAAVRPFGLAFRSASDLRRLPTFRRRLPT